LEGNGKDAIGKKKNSTTSTKRSTEFIGGKSKTGWEARGLKWTTAPRKHLTREKTVTMNTE